VISFLAQQAAASVPNPAQHPDYTGVLIGGLIAIAAAIITSAFTLLGSLLAHRRENKARRTEEKRKRIDELFQLAQKAYRECSTYRAHLARAILLREALPNPDALAFADNVVRLAGLHVPECETETERFAVAVKEFTDWAMSFGEHLIKLRHLPEFDVDAIDVPESDFAARIKAVHDPLQHLGERCSELMTALDRS
jgi:hypothetical protein